MDRYKIIDFKDMPILDDYYIQININGFLYTGFLKKHGELIKGGNNE